MKRFVKIGIGLLIATGALLALVYSMQEKLIFLPTTLDRAYEYRFEAPFEEVDVETKDGAQLNAIHFKKEAAKGVILYFHGNAGDLSRWGVISEYFTRFNYDVLVMDYRTYGKSTGKLSETALYEDAQLWYDYLLKKGYTEDQITVYGRSLGTTFASFIASENRPKQLILETPFYSLTEVAKKRFPFLPVKRLLKYKFPSFSFMPKVTCRTTVIHGTEDSVVAYESGKKLSEALPKEHVELVTISNGGHNNLIEFEAYRNKITQLLK